MRPTDKPLVVAAEIPPPTLVDMMTAASPLRRTRYDGPLGPPIVANITADI